MTRLSESQIEVLSDLEKAPGEAAEIWLNHSSYENMKTTGLGLKNFGRTMDALVKRGLIIQDGDGSYSITEEGIAALRSAK